MTTLTQLLVLVLVSGVSYTFSDQVDITVKPGQEAILPCQPTNSKRIDVVDWTSDNVGSYRVLLFRDSQFVTDQQHPSFKNRADLKDRQMKNGDVSLVLRNVVPEDGGTYKCRVFYVGTNNTNLNQVFFVNLNVAGGSRILLDRGSRAGSSGPVIGLTLLILLLFAD